MKHIFKAWDLINGGWLDLFSIKFSRSGEPIAVTTLDDETYGMQQVELVQWTGLRDKNLRRIYEGDIYLPPHGITRVIEFMDGCFTQANTFPTSPIESGGEVIGNIYENPDLLY